MKCFAPKMIFSAIYFNLGSKLEGAGVKAQNGFMLKLIK